MAQRVLIVGASVGGSVAASTLRAAGIETILLERELHKAKPCGGAVPPAAFNEFDLPHHLIDRKVLNCLVVSPSGRQVRFPVTGSEPTDQDYVAMVRREVFDGFLRERAQQQGATLIPGTLIRLYITESGVEATYRDPQGHERMLQADAVIGADGAYSPTARFLGLQPRPDSVAIQERIALPPEQMARWETTADLYLGREVSPDFYGWVFPKGDHVTVGVGLGRKHAKRARTFLNNLKARLGDALDGGTVLLREAHALPMTPDKHMAFDRAMLVGDAANLVARTSGEGIYWAMKSGQMAAEVLAEYLDVPSAQNLRAYERQWWKDYRAMYTFLRFLEVWGYGNERQMEVFTEMCASEDVQRLTFDSYMHKRMIPAPWKTQLGMTRDILVSQVRHYLWRRPRSAADLAAT
jgi:geranylgeranyl diphosphate/geranylgeranyl-bacteriochlorophyllide a reductase